MPRRNLPRRRPRWTKSVKELQAYSQMLAARRTAALDASTKERDEAQAVQDTLAKQVDEAQKTSGCGDGCRPATPMPLSRGRGIRSSDPPSRSRLPIRRLSRLRSETRRARETASRGVAAGARAKASFCSCCVLSGWKSSAIGGRSRANVCVRCPDVLPTRCVGRRSGTAPGRHLCRRRRLGRGLRAKRAATAN